VVEACVDALKHRQSELVLPSSNTTQHNTQGILLILVVNCFFGDKIFSISDGKSLKGQVVAGARGKKDNEN
jgi:hypothetical protein